MTFIKQLWKTWQWGIGKTILATVAAHGHSISVGLCQGFSAVLLPQLLEDDAELKVTTNEASWIAALGVISNPVGALLAGILMEIFGRKATIKIATFPYIIGWILIALSDDIVKLYVGRFISGLAVEDLTAITPLNNFLPPSNSQRKQLPVQNHNRCLKEFVNHGEDVEVIAKQTKKQQAQPHLLCVLVAGKK